MQLDVLSLRLTFDPQHPELVRFLQLDWERPYRLPIHSHYQVLAAPIAAPDDMKRVRYPDAEVFSAQTSDGLFLRCSTSLLQVCFHEKQVRFSGEGSGLRLNLMLALSELLRLEGFTPLHSSAVHWEGGAVALLAPSGTGKTTTLLQAARSQVTALSEDWAWTGPDLSFYPWDLGLHLLPDTVERFDDVLPETRSWLPRGARHKWRFDASDLEWFQPRSCSLKQIWVLQRNSETALTAVPRLDLVRALWEASGMPLTREAMKMAQQGINRLLSVPARRLQLGFEVNFSTLQTEN